MTAHLEAEQPTYIPCVGHPARHYGPCGIVRFMLPTTDLCQRQSSSIHGVNATNPIPSRDMLLALSRRKRLLMIKKHNFNAIRTSITRMCLTSISLRQYGFFVIDDATTRATVRPNILRGQRKLANHVENWNKPIADNRSSRGHRNAPASRGA